MGETMSKKKKNHKTNVMRILDQHQVPYTAYEFPWSEEHLGTESVAEEMGIAEAQIFKTLLTVGQQTGPIVAIIPGDQVLDLKKLANASGNKKIEMLHLKELEATTGYVRGGCSPIGMKKAFPTYLANEAQQFSEIIISAGKRGQQLAIEPIRLLQLTSGSYADLISHTVH